jgi:DNA helicase II / ATP-dependent DNA helicase PcrA
VTVTHRVVGPPGCGKTSWIARQCRRAVDRYGEDGALVLSLTRAAAHEAGGRDTGLAPRMIGNIHRVCYHALGRPKIAEDGEALGAFNEANPDMAVTSEDSWDWGDGPPSGRSDGDKLFAQLNMLRHRRVPRSDWPTMTVEFSDRWEEFKRERDLADFTDLIERAIEAVPRAPGAPSVIFADEAQDFSRLELDLLDSWRRFAEHLTLVYDPAQALYGWRGADESMASAEPSIVLSQSYRVPRAIRDFALAIVRQSSTYREAEYAPRDDDGEVRREPWRLADPAAYVEELDDPLEGTTMVLASCGFLLDPIVAEMRRRGVAYHNPFAPSRWSPLRSRRDRGQTTAADRVLAFLALGEAATAEALDVVATSLRAATLKPGWRDVLADVSAGALPAPAGMYRVLGEAALDAVERGDLDWYLGALLAAHARSATYPAAVARRSGARVLRAAVEADRPTPGVVVVGTIHSVKGGEADRVVLFPDLSRAGADSLASRPGWLRRDAVYRMFYVGATRARRALVLGEAGRSSRAVPLPEAP